MKKNLVSILAIKVGIRRREISSKERRAVKLTLLASSRSCPRQSTIMWIIITEPGHEWEKTPAGEGWKTLLQQLRVEINCTATTKLNNALFYVTLVYHLAASLVSRVSHTRGILVNANQAVSLVCCRSPE